MADTVKQKCFQLEKSHVNLNLNVRLLHISAYHVSYNISPSDLDL